MTKFAVYVVVIENTNESVEALSEISSSIAEYVVLDSEEEAIAEAAGLVTD
jgi:hypothetical protein